LETYGDLYWGGYATALQNPAKMFFHLPQGLDEQFAAPLMCAGVTTHNPIAKFCKPEQDVAVLGIGGLGHLCIKYAKSWGCKVTAFTNSKDKVELIKNLGADRVVIASDEDAMKKEKQNHDVILNTIPISSQEIFDTYYSLLDVQGTWVQLALPDMETNIKLYIGKVTLDETTIVGSMVGNVQAVKNMLDYSAKHHILPMCELYEFDDFPKAWGKLVHGRPQFRCVVKCKGAFK